jgi:tetratricopeptide (TPR) repeat protein
VAGNQEKAFTHAPVEAARASGDRVRETEALLELGRQHAAAGQSVEATRLFQQAVDVARATGRRLLVARSLANLGAQLHQSGGLDEALAVSRQAASEYRTAGNASGELKAVANCAATAHAMGRLDEAASAADDALALALALDNTPLLVGLYGLSAEVMVAQGRLDEARSARRDAVDAARHLAEARQLIAALDALGQLELARGDADEAVKAFSEAAELQRGGQGGVVAHRTLMQLGLAYERTQRWAEADAALGDALDGCRRAGDGEVEPLILEHLASAKLHLGQLAVGGRLADMAALSYRQRHDPRGAGRALAILGHSHEAVGRYADARRAYEEALELLTAVDPAAAEALRTRLGR